MLLRFTSRIRNFYRQFTGRSPQEKWRLPAFCYDEVVWQQQAVRQGRAFVKHIVPAIIKPLHSLWNQVIGFLFLSFAVIFGFKTAHIYMDWSKAAPGAGVGDLVRLVMAGFCTFLMGWFGVSSFLRARRISRS